MTKLFWFQIKLKYTSQEISNIYIVSVFHVQHVLIYKVLHMRLLSWDYIAYVGSPLPSAMQFAEKGSINCETSMHNYNYNFLRPNTFELKCNQNWTYNYIYRCHKKFSEPSSVSILFRFSYCWPAIKSQCTFIIHNWITLNITRILNIMYIIYVVFSILTFIHKHFVIYNFVALRFCVLISTNLQILIKTAGVLRVWAVLELPVRIEYRRTIKLSCNQLETTSSIK